MKSAVLLMTATATFLWASCPGIAADLGTNYTDRTGPDLVQTLLDANTRSRAFHELWNRANPTNQIDYDTFEEDHYDPEVIVCPQNDGAPPLYVVLYGYLSREHYSPTPQYEIQNPSELFVSLDPPKDVRTWDEPALAVFAADGKEITPFGGDNVITLPGRMADLNGDGLVERADHVNCGVGSIDDVTVLEIAIVSPKPQTLLSVLFNWGADEWTYQFTDANTDGILEVELGPKTLNGMKPKVTFAWNKETESYVGPTGAEGDHFRRLDANNELFSKLDRLEESGLKFPADADFADEQHPPTDSREARGFEKRIAENISNPYCYASLRHLSNEEILRFMGRGNNALELNLKGIVQTHVPENFWFMDAKVAALALANANRYPIHRELFDLAVDDRDGQLPPDVGSIAFTQISDKSYFDVDRHYFLRVDPTNSYLAYAQSENSGIVSFNFVNIRPVYDFRLCKLDYEEARHLAHVLWWMDRIRSRRDTPSDEFGSMWSSADGRGSLVFRNADGAEIFRRNGTLWSDHVAERWRGDYDPEVNLNLASFLIAQAFTNRLGTRWSAQAPPQKARACGLAATACPPLQPSNAPAWIAEFLDLFSPSQTAISLAITREAARAAGDFAMTNLADKLTDVQDRLPPDGPPKRTPQEIEAEIESLRAIQPSDGGWKEAARKKMELNEELMAIYRNVGADDVPSLRKSIDQALRKIRCADDLETLQNWACTEEPGGGWALQRLKAKDRMRYVAALEWWVHNTKEDWARQQAFAAIAQENSARALEIAEVLAPGAGDDLPGPTFAQLAKANGLPDGPPRIAALIQIVLSTNSNLEERRLAIEGLVPPDQPMRYPDPEIDESLVKLFDPALADETMNFTLANGCRALARRERTEYFDPMADLLQNIKDPMIYDLVLEAVAHLAQCNPTKYNPRLVDILRPQFKNTNKRVQDLLMVAWATNLRELKPDVERIATSGPDDYESERANSYGGEESPLDDRFHLARQIAAIWNEDDPATQGKLLLALGFTDAPSIAMEPKPERVARMKAELDRLADTLTPKQREQVKAFGEWIRSTQIAPERAAQDPRAKFIDFAMKALSPPAN